MSEHIEQPAGFRFTIGDPVRKKRGARWHGLVVGFYSSSQTPEGYAVESSYERGSVQIYPVDALELWTPVRLASRDQ